jgi:hypothetical protein
MIFRHVWAAKKPAGSEGLARRSAATVLAAFRQFAAEVLGKGASMGSICDPPTQYWIK